MDATDAYEELVPVPLVALELPLSLPLPPAFDPARPESWPRVEGQLEYVDGKLLYMPPTGDLQQDTCADLVGVLHRWRRAHPEFVVAGNEAGILIGGETRGADGAVWLRADLPAYGGGVRRVAPILAAEVAGRYDSEQYLRAKARWYLERGTGVVWLLFPAELRVVVLTAAGETTLVAGERLPPHPELPELEVSVDELFEQVASRGGTSLSE